MKASLQKLGEKKRLDAFGDLKTENLFRLDESLKDLVALIEEKRKSVKLVTVDFFDTLVFRLSHTPVDLFLEVGRRLIIRGLNKNFSTPKEFKVLREKAEVLSREKKLKQKGTNEVSIEEIYDVMGEVVNSKIEAIWTELQVEKEYCWVNPSIEGLLKFLKNYGVPVVVISDTYLSSSQLGDILSFNGFDMELLEGIYSSSDNGTSKAEGGLFDRVLLERDVTPGQVIHIGDNRYSDLRVPLLKGMNALLYYKDSAFIEDIFSREELVGGERIDFSRSLTSLRVLSQRLVPEGVNVEAYKIGAFVFGPIFSRFCHWCLEKMEDEKVELCLAFMREGVLFSKLLNIVSAAFGRKVDVREFYVSRVATALPSVGEINVDSLRRLSYRKNPPTVKEFFRSFGFEEGEINLPEEYLNKRVNTEEMRRVLLEFFCKPRLREILERKAKKERAKFLKYYRKLKGAAKKITFIDLGWGGTINNNIRKAFSIEGENDEIINLFFATGEGIKEKVLEGMRVFSYLNEVVSEKELRDSVLRTPEIFEQVVTANEGSTVGYDERDGEVVPVMENCHRGEGEKKIWSSVSKGIEVFTMLYSNLVKRKGRSSWGEPVISREFLKNLDKWNAVIMKRVSMFPIEEEVSVLGSFSHDDNYGTDINKRIIALGEREESLKGEGGLLCDYACYWPYGTMAALNPMSVYVRAYGWRFPLLFEGINFVKRSSRFSLILPLLELLRYITPFEVVHVLGIGNEVRDFPAIPRDKFKLYVDRLTPKSECKKKFRKKDSILFIERRISSEDLADFIRKNQEVMRSLKFLIVEIGNRISPMKRDIDLEVLLESLSLSNFLQVVEFVELYENYPFTRSFRVYRVLG